MVLSLQNSGKYLSRSWIRERAAAMETPAIYTAAQLTYYEVPAITVPQSAFVAQTTPFEPDGTARDYDIRLRPETGGSV
jgi:hypothetical protein